MTLPALSKSVPVSCTPSEAFQVFTAGISAWWPLKSHSVFADDALCCVFEAWAGGRLFERSVHGGEALWGHVLLSEPGHRVFFTWHPGRPPSSAQEVRVHFVASQGGARVELEHLGWEALGERAEATRCHYETGWDEVLVAGFGGCANRKHHPPHVTG